MVLIDFHRFRGWVSAQPGAAWGSLGRPGGGGGCRRSLGRPYQDPTIKGATRIEGLKDGWIDGLTA